MNNYFLTRYFFARQLTLFSLPFDSNYTTLINVFYFQMNIIKVYYYTDPRQLFVVVSSSILWLMKIIHRNEFFVLFLILFVRTNYIDLHHFILVILLSFNINRFLQNLHAPNIALVLIPNDLRHLVIRLRKFELITNASLKQHLAHVN